MQTTLKTISTTKRQTVQEAYETVLENSRLRKLAEEGGDFCEEAVREDLAAFYQLIDNICEDLTLLCQDTGHVYKRTRVVTVDGKNASEAWENFKKRTYSFMFLSLRVFCIKDSKLFPITVIDFDPEHMGIVFADDRYNYTRLGFKSAALICPEDFPKRIPSDAAQVLERLKVTHYDYNPKILEGKVENKKSIDIDPGLCIWVDEALLLVRHWDEPWSRWGRYFAWKTPVFYSFLKCTFGAMVGLTAVSVFLDFFFPNFTGTWNLGAAGIAFVVASLNLTGLWLLERRKGADVYEI